MSFRTLGWFGPECFLSTTRWNVAPPKYLEIYNSQTGSNQDFPLELAMKIFWESQTISINASLTWVRFFSGPQQYVPFTASYNETLNWGERRSNFIDLPSARTGLQTAKELLCSSSHTTLLLSGGNTGGGTGELQFDISRRPFAIYENGGYRIFAPIFVLVRSGSGAGVVDNNEFPIQDVAEQMGECLITTPWGNTSSPIIVAPPQTQPDGFVLSFVESVSIAIDFTAADPATRYA
jgi:hypothetical protein